MKRKVEIVILSDVHLGTFGCHAKELLHYLKSVQMETLIINGDFIDFWQFKKRFFPTEHVQIIQQILKRAVSGTKVYYMTGNHDESLRPFSGFSAGNFHLRDELVLQLNGEKYWIFHGDIFDASIMYSPWLARLGSHSYELLILLNRFINKVRSRLGRKKRSFAAFVKKSVKNAVKYISDFEETAIRYGIEKKYDYVVCGHIHKPQIRQVVTGKGSIRYLNAGDWVENLTALEYSNKEWRLYHYSEDENAPTTEPVSPKRKAKPVEDFEQRPAAASAKQVTGDWIYELLMQLGTGKSAIEK